MDIIVKDVRSVSASIHHEKRDVSMFKVVVVLIFFNGFVVAISIVQFKGVGSIWEWRCRIVCETLKIIDNLGGH